MAASSSSSSSRHLLNHYATTSAPPPTPSAQPSSSTISAAADTLSLLLHRLPVNLSLPTRFSRAPTTPTPTLLSSALDLGFFQLTTHPISPQLAESAELESFSLSRNQKLAGFLPQEWPLGFDNCDEDEEEKDEATSFCMDGACSTTAKGSELKLASLRELTRELEKLGLGVAESLACAMGFENPFSGKVEPTSLMWISEEGDKAGRVYPYVVGLQYQIRARKYSLITDSGTVIVEPMVGSVLVTLGDIAQVWSNGRVKKVRGRTTLISDKKASISDSISMTLLLTLPLESTISPLTLVLKNKPSKIAEPNDPETEPHTLENNEQNDHEIVENITSNDDYDQMVFKSFSLEDYAWRVYHERVVPLKDPLDRYRLILH